MVALSRVVYGRLSTRAHGQERVRRRREAASAASRSVWYFGSIGRVGSARRRVPAGRYTYPVSVPREIGIRSRDRVTSPREAACCGCAVEAPCGDIWSFPCGYAELSSDILRRAWPFRVATPFWVPDHVGGEPACDVGVESGEDSVSGC